MPVPSLPMKNTVSPLNLAFWIGSAFGSIYTPQTVKLFSRKYTLAAVTEGNATNCILERVPLLPWKENESRTRCFFESGLLLTQNTVSKLKAAAERRIVPKLFFLAMLCRKRQAFGLSILMQQGSEEWIAAGAGLFLLVLQVPLVLYFGARLIKGTFLTVLLDRPLRACFLSTFYALSILLELLLFLLVLLRLLAFWPSDSIQTAAFESGAGLVLSCLLSLISLEWSNISHSVRTGGQNPSYKSSLTKHCLGHGLILLLLIVDLYFNIDRVQETTAAFLSLEAFSVLCTAFLQLKAASELSSALLQLQHTLGLRTDQKSFMRVMGFANVLVFAYLGLRLLKLYWTVIDFRLITIWGSIYEVVTRMCIGLGPLGFGLGLKAGRSRQRIASASSSSDSLLQRGQQSILPGQPRN